MSSVSSLLATAMLFGYALGGAAATTLRVCSDPNDLPYSNRQQQGFENRIAELIAKDMGMDVSYFWFPQREAFFKKTLNSGACDVVMGVPVGFDQADVTHPYYRSAYVFVSRRDRNLRIDSFDDPRLKTLRVGVNVLGEQSESLPPVYALTSRGIARNLVGYSVFRDLSVTHPSQDLIDAVLRNDVDVAIAWGPLAGYLAKQSKIPMDLVPVEADAMHPALPLAFDIGMGVRLGDAALKHQLDMELIRRHKEIDQILRSYGVPQLSLATMSAAGEN
jgi:quinoprotein dehydrogenase-associated probable ABC transporter substrate-binding protein